MLFNILGKVKLGRNKLGYVLWPCELGTHIPLMGHLTTCVRETSPSGALFLNSYLS